MIFRKLAKNNKYANGVMSWWFWWFFDKFLVLAKVFCMRGRTSCSFSQEVCGLCTQTAQRYENFQNPGKKWNSQKSLSFFRRNFCNGRHFCVGVGPSIFLSCQRSNLGVSKIYGLKGLRDLCAALSAILQKKQHLIIGHPFNIGTWSRVKRVSEGVWG